MIWTSIPDVLALVFIGLGIANNIRTMLLYRGLGATSVVWPVKRIRGTIAVSIGSGVVAFLWVLIAITRSL